jgi:hypothetical protein
MRNLIWTWLFFWYGLPTIFYASHLCTSHFAHHQESSLRISLSIASALIAEGYAIRKLLRVIDVRNRSRKCYEAESAVGSKLNQSMLDGPHVFHDVQAEKFNIDHLVISPKGFFWLKRKAE